MTTGNKNGFSTRAIHNSRGYTGNTGAVMPPVYLTSTFEQGNADGFDYTRSGNPNFRLLEKSLASLEGAEHATCFASGLRRKLMRESGRRLGKSGFIPERFILLNFLMVSIRKRTISIRMNLRCSKR